MMLNEIASRWRPTGPAKRFWRMILSLFPLFRDYLFTIFQVTNENVPLLNCQIRIIHEGIYLEVLLESPEINVRRSDCDKTVINDKCLSMHVSFSVEMNLHSFADGCL